MDIIGDEEVRPAGGQRWALFHMHMQTPLLQEGKWDSTWESSSPGSRGCSRLCDVFFSCNDALQFAGTLSRCFMSVCRLCLASERSRNFVSQSEDTRCSTHKYGRRRFCASIFQHMKQYTGHLGFRRWTNSRLFQLFGLGAEEKQLWGYKVLTSSFKAVWGCSRLKYNAAEHTGFYQVAGLTCVSLASESQTQGEKANRCCSSSAGETASVRRCPRVTSDRFWLENDLNCRTTFS